MDFKEKKKISGNRRAYFFLSHNSVYHGYTDFGLVFRIGGFILLLLCELLKHSVIRDVGYFFIDGCEILENSVPVL